MLTPATPLRGVASPAEPLPGEVREPLSGGASPLSGDRASPKTEGPWPVPVPATGRRGAAMRNNGVPRPNVVTRRAAVELTGVVTRYRVVHLVNNHNTNNNNHNTNNNNHAVLVERFQPSTLQKLRQQGLYINTDTPDSVHQLDAQVAAAEVTFTMTNTQPSCSRGGETDRISNTFKEAVRLTQAARWKAVSDKEIANLEKHGIFKLITITSVPAGHRAVGTRLMLKMKADSTYKGQLAVQGFPQVLGMNVTRNHEKRAITISQKYFTEDVVQ